MEPNELLSIDDPRLDPFRSIKGRSRDDGTFVAESEIVLDRLLEADFAIRAVLITPARATRLQELLQQAQATRGDTFDVLVASKATIDQVVGYPLHRGVISLAERKALPSAESLLATARTVLIAEEVADPENLGSLFRHAAAFGVDAVILHGPTADPLYRKTVRTSMGWALTIPYARTSPTEHNLAELLRAAGLVSLALTPDPSAASVLDVLVEISDHAKLAVLVGAEGPGLRPETRAQATYNARIPMSADVDSLNVATSAAIALFALTARQPARLAGTSVQPKRPLT